MKHHISIWMIYIYIWFIYGYYISSKNYIWVIHILTIYLKNHCWMVADQPPARCRRRRNWKPSLSHCPDAKAPPRQGGVIEKVWHRKTIGKPWENEGLLSGYVNIAIENGQLE